MLRATTKKSDGTQLIILGIDKGNVKRLRKGRPIHLYLGEMGIPNAELLIHYRDTLRELEADFQDFITLKTKVSYDPSVEAIMDGEPDDEPEEMTVRVDAGKTAPSHTALFGPTINGLTIAEWCPTPDGGLQRHSPRGHRHEAQEPRGRPGSHRRSHTAPQQRLPGGR